MQEGTHFQVARRQSTELEGGDPVLGLFANPDLVYTLPTLEDLPSHSKIPSLKYSGRIL